ncbi:MAG: hypothetical protein ACI7YS_07970 [Flavobacterium sp.]
MKNIIAVLSVMVLCSNSCEKPPFVEKFYGVMVTNNSSAEIRVLLADEHAAKQYPDTTLPASKPALQKAPVGKSCYFDYRTPMEENIKKLPADTLSVYFIDNAIYENEPWDSVRIHYKILKRLDLSIEDLRNMNWTIIYDEN